MIRKLACAASAAVLLASAGCARSGGGQAADPPAAVQPADDVAQFLGRDDEQDGMDCDPDDKAKREIPDCGFYAGANNETFFWWSWVKAGRTTPPPGWDVRAEVKPHRQARDKPRSTVKPRSTTKPGSVPR